MEATKTDYIPKRRVASYLKTFNLEWVLKDEKLFEEGNWFTIVNYDNGISHVYLLNTLVGILA